MLDVKTPKAKMGMKKHTLENYRDKRNCKQIDIKYGWAKDS